MFCSRCGKSLMTEDIKCPFCGSPVGESRFEGMPYTSAQLHIKPGMRISYFADSENMPAEAKNNNNAEQETASAFSAEAAPAYTRISYTSMTDEEKEAGDADTRTTYRPIYEGASVPEDVRRDMRAAMAEPEEEPEEEDIITEVEDLSEEALSTLNAVDEELKMEEMDLSQFRARKIEATDRAGISAGVTDYIQDLEEKQYRKASRKRRSYDEDMDEAYATPQEEPLYEDDLPVNPDIDTEQPEVFDDIDEEEFDELRYGRVIGVKDILKIALIMVVAAALFVGIFLGIRHFRGQQANSAPIEGVTQVLYTEGIAQLKANVAGEYVEEMIGVFKDQGILALTTALVTDGRFSGTNNGCFVGHVSPEAAEGGPIALVRDGDRIVIDVKAHSLELLVSEEELAERRAAWQRPEPKFKTGWLAMYSQLAASAAEGAIMKY